MAKNSSSSRLEQESLRILEQAFSEFGKSWTKKPFNLIDCTEKFTEYYKLFKQVFPECVRGYDLKSPYIALNF